MSLRDLNLATVTPSQTVEYLMELELICKNRVCVCGKAMKLLRKVGNKDEKIWNCNNSKCKKQRSIRAESIFEKSKLPLHDILQILYCFAGGLRAVDTKWILNDSVSYNAISAWYQIFRKIMTWILENDAVDFKFNGADLTLGSVEIDESLFGKKAKYGRGTSCQKYLVFGIVERSGTRCILRIVDTNSKERLIPIIRRFVATDCCVYHDGLATYDKLHDYGYTHKRVNHSIEFVTEEGNHTNTIEGLWGLVKQKISYMHGLNSVESLKSHLDDYTYRTFFGLKKDPTKFWRTFLEHIKLYAKSNTLAHVDDGNDGASTSASIEF